MWPDQVSNTEPLTYESAALPTALRGPARAKLKINPSIELSGLTDGMCVILL